MPSTFKSSTYEEEECTSRCTTESLAPQNEKTDREYHHHEYLTDATSVATEVQNGTSTNGQHIQADEERCSTSSNDVQEDVPMTVSRAMSLVAMAFLWTGSQIPIYMFGGVPPMIYNDIGGTDRWTWLVLANLLALAAVCPFVGGISDLVGRRYVAISGTVLVITGCIICSKAETMNLFIWGMAIAGAGAGINELTALAATSELAPTSQRGKYVACLIFTLLPFAPSVLWAQLIAQNGHWRYIGLFCSVWNFIGLVAVVVFYYPPPRTNSSGLSNREVFARIDFLGGFLSITGIILFVAGLLWGGAQYKWATAHVLAPLILGIVFLIVFCLWEVYGAPYPLFPSRLLSKSPRILILTLIITFISGANFFSVLLLWPSQAYQVYGHSAVGVGIRGLPVGFGILTGACVVLYLLSHFRGGNKWLMVGASILMTAGTGALAAATEDNIGAVYVCLAIAGLGIGGIVIPASIITTIICPDDLIATVAALTLAIRVMGGAIGYTTYYNIFVNKFTPNLVRIMSIACQENGITDATVIEEICGLTSVSLIHGMLDLPGVDGNITIWHSLVKAGQHAFAISYPDVYYCTIAFGGVAIIAALFLGDISEYMDDHVAVIMH